MNKNQSSFKDDRLKQTEFTDKYPGIPMVMMIKVNAVRKKQLLDGFIDCFGRASSGHCDQKHCKYYKKCMDISYVFKDIECNRI